MVDEIWNGKDTTTGTALVRVGPYTISDTSIRHLKGAISDEVSNIEKSVYQDVSSIYTYT